MKKLILIVLIVFGGCTTAFEKRADENFLIIQNVLNAFNKRLAKVEGVELEDTSSEEKVISEKKGIQDGKDS